MGLLVAAAAIMSSSLFDWLGEALLLLLPLACCCWCLAEAEADVEADDLVVY
jgi:hypothetical protein